MGKKVGQSTFKNRKTPWNSKGFCICSDYSSSTKDMWLSIYLVVSFAVLPLHIYVLFVFFSFTGLFVVNLSSDGTPLPLDKLEILLLFLLLFQPFIIFFEWISSFYRVSLDFTYLLERPAPTN